MAETKGRVQVIEYTFSTTEVQSTRPVLRKLNTRFDPRMVKCRAICQPSTSSHQAVVKSDMTLDENLCVFSYTEPVNGTGSFREMNRNRGQTIGFTFYEKLPTTGTEQAGLSEFAGTTEILTISLTFID